MIISALGKSINQLYDPKFKKVFLKSVILCVVFLIFISTVFAYFFLNLWSSLDLPFGFIISSIGGAFLFFLGMWVFGPTIAVIFNSFFQDEIILAVEKKHYRDINIQSDSRLLGEIKFNLKLLSKLIILNIIIIPLIIVPPIYFIFYWVINGYLISFEYINIMKNRYNHEINLSGKKFILLVYGIIILILFTVPIVNFFAPTIGIASAVHIYNNFLANK